MDKVLKFETDKVNAILETFFEIFCDGLVVLVEEELVHVGESSEGGDVLVERHVVLLRPDLPVYDGSALIARLPAYPDDVVVELLPNLEPSRVDLLLRQVVAVEAKAQLGSTTGDELVVRLPL